MTVVALDLLRCRRGGDAPQPEGIAGARAPSHCSAPYLSYRSTSENPSFAATRTARELAVWVRSTTGCSVEVDHEATGAAAGYLGHHAFELLTGSRATGVGTHLR